MCSNKRRYDVGYERTRSDSFCKPWNMSWIPFVVIMFFVFGPHTWGFASHAWMWFLLPAAVVGSSFFVKTTQSRTSTREVPQQTEHTSIQPYQQGAPQHGLQETYQEGGQQFQYPQQQEQVQQISYEEPHADYPQATHPIE